jgi:lysine N6-hydroxylase
MLYKGINFSLIGEIYDLLYAQQFEEKQNPVRMQANVELKNMLIEEDQKMNLSFLHGELNESFIHESDTVILATGYKTNIPDFITPLKDKIQWNGNATYKANRNYSIDTDNTLFVQNAESATHGFNAADLGLGPYRNAIILNTILQREHFIIEENVSFQTFGLS